MMKKRPMFPVILVFISLALVSSAHAQTPAPQPTPLQTRPRTVTIIPPQQQPTPQPTPRTVAPQNRPPATYTPQTAPRPSATPTPRVVPPPSTVLPSPVATGVPAHSLSMSKIRSHLTEAQRLLKSRPMPTVMMAPAPSTMSGNPSMPTPTSPPLSTVPPATNPSPSLSRPSPTSYLYFVTLAALDTSTSKIHLITLPKALFLSRGAEANVTTSLGSAVQLRIIRANGVNTAVTIFDSAGRSLTPLVVQYPIERNGFLREMGYYTSAHPALLSPEVVKSGQAYVRTMLDLAARRLKDKGVTIPPNLIDIAERLCIVEHVDHSRFNRENRIALYEEIFALYALNELNTYNYSVSTAGAGGMIQMIPSTYQMIRRLHPGIGLNPDFVAGMRNHGNALEAMLLYVLDTWTYLARNADVTYALNSKLATQWELMAAGYNSNPAKLPGYINRGGTAWRTLIPRETQIYLQIYRSVDSLIPMKPRS
jgi:hypothetical protein